MELYALEPLFFLCYLQLTKENEENSRLSKRSQQIVQDVSEENEQLFGNKT